MKSWKPHLLKISLLLMLFITCIEFITINVTQATADDAQVKVPCSGESAIKDTDHSHPGYMILKNGVKLQYVNGLSVYQEHKELSGGLIIELFPVNATARYDGYLNGDVCVPRVLTIKKLCN